ncbi:L-serine ammonia-lyase, iron-sulfur-dependent, subunit alpha [Citroniella saccharovorans]|uniref:L-serine dehydratase n=1 Tax=Citroniella saccharovorans TaxID=2053367 RepID=A0AAW9MYW2_9FIRM|nr:L-serine ammonia-lyase, iron-sulfur-dependent, subunit alpha [Citroniella saccharovorans]MEB3429697.1 L-serine ammonia-lyase, iron-sulfur-dependent, subunit alpha [Citroniella saccharovorans]
MYRNAEDLLRVCNDNNITISEATLRHEIEESGKPKKYFIDRFKEIYEVMKSSSSKGLSESIHTMSGITGGNAKRIEDYRKEGKSLCDDFLMEAMARAFSTLEINGAMGKIVAAPTAGASGIIPAAFTSVQNKLNLDDDTMIKGLLTASQIGGIIAMNATISGAEGGCQAETGAASAMAAAALVEIMGGSVEQSLHAASFAIMNVLGLVCDPIAGLVEFPCALRNASGVTNSIISCDLAMAGVKSIIPFDEVVMSMFEVGNSLPASLRETALGGLANTPTGRTFCASCNGACTGI